ncbi:MAG: hypothetical protein ACOCQR_02480 [bacterium]
MKRKNEIAEHLTEQYTQAGEVVYGFLSHPKLAFLFCSIIFPVTVAYIAVFTDMYMQFNMNIFFTLIHFLYIFPICYRIERKFFIPIMEDVHKIKEGRRFLSVSERIISVVLFIGMAVAMHGIFITPYMFYMILF